MSRGLCSSCQRDMSIRVDGAVRKHHQVGTGRACPGSGQPPAVTLPQDPELRCLVLRARNLRLLAEQRLAAAELACRLARQRIGELLAGVVAGNPISASGVSTTDQMLFSHPDLIDLDLADAYWRPEW
jgi:hypothetical protein